MMSGLNTIPIGLVTIQLVAIVVSAENFSQKDALPQFYLVISSCVVNTVLGISIASYCINKKFEYESLPSTVNETPRPFAV